MESVAEILEELIEFLVGGSALASFLFGFGLSNLWPMIEGMQLMIHYPLLGVSPPANIGMF
jgi:hypothetical protein